MLYWLSKLSLITHLPERILAPSGAVSVHSATGNGSFCAKQFYSLPVWLKVLQHSRRFGSLIVNGYDTIKRISFESWLIELGGFHFTL